MDTTEQPIRIGQLAARIGVNPKTIRYYESIGLLPEPKRWPSGYRAYDADDLKRVAFIRRAQQFGLRLDAIGETLALRHDCGTLEPKQLTARRAGGVRSAPLAQAGGCRFSGELVLPDRGQWFVYAELLDQGALREAWMPVLVGDGSWSGAKATELYAPRRPEDSSFQQLAGVVLYGANLALVIAVVVLYRRERARAQLGQPPRRWHEEEI